MDVLTVYNTTKYSIKSILRTYGIDEIQIKQFDRWQIIQRKLDEIKTAYDYFQALSQAEQIIEEARRFIKDKAKGLYG